MLAAASTKLYIAITIYITDCFSSLHWWKKKNSHYTGQSKGKVRLVRLPFLKMGTCWWEHSAGHNSDFAEPWPSLQANYLLATLAVSDLLTACLTQPIFVAFHVEMLLNKTSCVTSTILTAFRSLTTMASVFTAFAVCLERTLAIMVPFYYEAWITPRRLIVAPVSAWIVFSLFDASRFVGFPKGPIAGVRSVVLVICLVSTVVCYGLMVRAANKHTKQIASQEPDRFPGRSRPECGEQTKEHPWEQIPEDGHLRERCLLPLLHASCCWTSS